VRFSINERDYLRLAREFLENRERLGPEEDLEGPREDRNLKLFLADGSLHPHPGHVVAYDAAINPTTGTFTMEADFDNPEGIVLAGQFARVRGVVERRENAVMVPTRAVAELQGVFRVFVVGDDNSIEIRSVELGPELDRMRIIESGLEAGERIAVEGLLRLRNGSVINPMLIGLDDVNPGAKPDQGS
jgi:membrane fusion protein (multidrug efflux system)